MDLNRDRSKELLEERGGLRKLGVKVPSDFDDGSLGKYQTKEAKLAENQTSVAGAGAGQQSRDQDVSVETNG